MENPWNRNAVISGQNFRLANLNASLALSQFSKLDRLNQIRRGTALTYIQEIGDIEEITVMGRKSLNANSWQMFPILVSGARDELVYRLIEAGIEASVHFDPPIHRQDAYIKHSEADLPNTRYLSESVVTLPMHPGLTQSEVVKISAVVKAALS